MSSPFDASSRFGRRAFVGGTTLWMFAAACSSQEAWSQEQKAVCKIALITDLHHADKDAAGTRYYRETLAKLDEASQKFAELEIDFVVELGDLIDAASDVETELAYLRTINQKFVALHEDRHYVLGNHCVDTLTKQEFLGAVEQESSYYSFDRKGWHFVVLDACFRSDGQPYERKNFEWTDANLSQEEMEWLERDLKANSLPTIVFAHQRLDVSDNHGVKNNEAIRQLFESVGNVRAVFQGHSHQNDHHEINGVHYCTLVAMVEGSGEEDNAYSVLTILDDQTLKLEGFRKQQDYEWRP